ncbi:MAG: kinase [Rudaea sp.]|nr:kinase [Rudaea sp.]
MSRDAITQAGYPDAIVGAVLAYLLRKKAGERPWLVGVSGLQGSGKSTLAAQLVERARAQGMYALGMSIDDFYFGRSRRLRLARTVHPLLATRGVPGTHDLPLLESTLRDLRRASARRPARVPRFDKGRDTRLPPSRWRHVTRPPELVILEGWCVGVTAEPAHALRRPLNLLEREQDRDARWRTWVNAQLERDYAALWRRLDRLVLLRAPRFRVVRQWRDEQERALRQRNAPRAMSPAVLRRFLMHYERLSRQALRGLPAHADLCLALDRQRRVTRIVERGQPPASTTTAVP